MFRSISKNQIQLHRTALDQAIERQNAKGDVRDVMILVGTKNVFKNIMGAMFSRDFIILYFTGLGRLYTDYGIFGRFAFALMVMLSSVRKDRHAIVENEFDRQVIQRWTARSVSLINGSGFNASLYQFKKKKKSSTGKVIGYMSRFGTSKCTDQILKILDTLPPDYRMIIAGGDIRGSYYSGRFYQRAAEHPNIEMLGFLHTPQEVSHFFQRIDLLLYPSVREGLPITLLESLYHHVPFLTTDAPGCIDLSKRLGFPTCSPQNFGSQKNHLNVEEWGGWSPTWKTILEEFSTPKVQAQFEEIFDAIIDSKRK